MKWIPGFLLVLAGCSSGENLQNDKINDGIQTALNECADDVESDRCKALDVAIANAVSDPASQTQAAVLTLLAGNEAFQDGVAESLATGRWNTGSTESDPFVDSVAKQVVDGHGEGLAALIAGELANNPVPYTSFYTELASSITETTESLGALPEAVAQELASTHLTVLAGEVAAASGFASTVAVDVAELITDPEGTYEFISDVTNLVAAQVSAEGSALIATLAADDTFIEAVTGTASSTYLLVDGLDEKLDEYVNTATDTSPLWSKTYEIVDGYVAAATDETSPLWAKTTEVVDDHVAATTATSPLWSKTYEIVDDYVAAATDETSPLWAKTIEVVDAEVDANTDEVSTLGALAAQFQTAADVTNTLNAYTMPTEWHDQIEDELDNFFPSSESDSSFAEALAYLTELQGVVDLETELVTFHGVNVQIVDDSGATVSTSGLGNLIVGYNGDGFADDDDDLSAIDVDDDRSGSHNLIVGDEHTYSAYGGIVSGYDNSVAGGYATVVGGEGNEASGLYATVSGGESNNATGTASSVSGGTDNWATALWTSVSGGRLNYAMWDGAWVGGGGLNTAGYAGAETGSYTAILGGYNGRAYSDYSTVIGGNGSTDSDDFSIGPENPWGL